MAKVTFEFDENDDRDDINVIINRHKLLGALYAISDLHSSIYNGKLYNDVIINVKDGKVLTQEDYDKLQEAGEYPAKGTKEYIDRDFVEGQLDTALHHIYDILNY